MDVVDGHLVHALEVRHRRVDELERDLGAGDAGIGLARRRLLGLREHWLEALDGIPVAPVQDVAQAANHERVGDPAFPSLVDALKYVLGLGDRVRRAGDDDGVQPLVVGDAIAGEFRCGPLGSGERPRRALNRRRPAIAQL